MLRLLLTAAGTDGYVEIGARAWNVFWLVDGKIARRRLFRIDDRHDPLTAAGLRE